MEVKEKKCPFCGKVVVSIYDKQLDYNYKSHLLACRKKRGIQDSSSTSVSSVETHYEPQQSTMLLGKEGLLLKPLMDPL